MAKAPVAAVVPLDTIRPQTANANAHTPRGMAALETSLRADGWIGAITVAADGETFDGSARVEQGAVAGFADALIVESDGTRPIVVKRTDIPTATDPRAVRLGLAANRVAELNLGWDASVLATLDPPLLEGLWRPEELAELLATIPPDVVPGAGGDEFDPTPAEGPTRCQPGDLWQIGPHRLLVGDSTDPAHVARLMDGQRAGAVVTDPPYGQNQDGVMNDTPDGLRQLFDGILGALPASDAVVIAFQSTRLFPEWLDAIRAHGHKFERALTYYDTGGWSTYPWRGWMPHSQIILVSSVGKPTWPVDPTHVRDVYSINNQLHSDTSFTSAHPTMKHLDTVASLIEHTTGLVYDPFLGSGTTLIAAHRTGRICYGCEIELKYADVIIRRAEAEGIAPIIRLELGAPDV